MKQPRRRLAAVAASLILALLAGCGGASRDGANTGHGALRLTIRWPERSERGIPAATESLKLMATLVQADGEELFATRVVTRPAEGGDSQVLFDDLPPVRVRIDVTAHATADGSDQVLAAGSVEVDVPEDGTVEAMLTLDGRVASVRVDPASQTVEVGGTVTVLAEALDEDGVVILTADEDWSWSGGGSVASVTDGVNPTTVTGLAPGEASLVATHVSTGESARATVTVNEPFDGEPNARSRLYHGTATVEDVSVPGVLVPREVYLMYRETSDGLRLLGLGGDSEFGGFMDPWRYKWLEISGEGEDFVGAHYPFRQTVPQEESGSGRLTEARVTGEWRSPFMIFRYEATRIDYPLPSRIYEGTYTRSFPLEGESRTGTAWIFLQEPTADDAEFDYWFWLCLDEYQPYIYNDDNYDRVPSEPYGTPRGALPVSVADGLFEGQLENNSSVEGDVTSGAINGERFDGRAFNEDGERVDRIVSFSGTRLTEEPDWR